MIELRTNIIVYEGLRFMFLALRMVPIRRNPLIFQFCTILVILKWWRPRMAGGWRGANWEIQRKIGRDHHGGGVHALRELAIGR